MLIASNDNRKVNISIGILHPFIFWISLLFLLLSVILGLSLGMIGLQTTVFSISNTTVKRIC